MLFLSLIGSSFSLLPLSTSLLAQTTPVQQRRLTSVNKKINITYKGTKKINVERKVVKNVDILQHKRIKYKKNEKNKQTIVSFSWHNRTYFSGNQAIEAVRHWLPIIKKISYKENMNPKLVASVILHESGGNPYAVSGEGAYGLMQINSNYYKKTNSLFNPVKNIEIGVSMLHNAFLSFHGDWPLVLASYNAGITTVKEHGIPQYVKPYIKEVLQDSGSQTVLFQ